MRFVVLSLLLLVSLRAEVPPLLAEMTERWADERSRWTFTQVVREYDGPKVATTRVEHYDVTRGESHRWKLISLDGREPTPGEEAAWSKRKNRPRLFAARPLGDYLDLANARVVREDERSVSFEVPISRVMAWLLSGEKISLVLTVDRQTHLLEHGRVELGGPFTIALGLAKVIDLDVELELPVPLTRPSRPRAAVLPWSTSSAAASNIPGRISRGCRRPPPRARDARGTLQKVTEGTEGVWSSIRSLWSCPNLSLRGAREARDEAIQADGSPRLAEPASRGQGKLGYSHGFLL
jgi:hypothetical protein